MVRCRVQRQRIVEVLEPQKLPFLGGAITKKVTASQDSNLISEVIVAFVSGVIGSDGAGGQPVTGYLTHKTTPEGGSKQIQRVVINETLQLKQNSHYGFLLTLTTIEGWESVANGTISMPDLTGGEDSSLYYVGGGNLAQLAKNMMGLDVTTLPIDSVNQKVATMVHDFIIQDIGYTNPLASLEYKCQIIS